MLPLLLLVLLLLVLLLLVLLLFTPPWCLRVHISSSDVRSSVSLSKQEQLAPAETTSA
jgi:hypothetical protein